MITFKFEGILNYSAKHFLKSAAFTPITLSSIHHFKFLEVIAVFKHLKTFSPQNRIQSYSITNHKGSAIVTIISDSRLRIEWKTFLAFTSIILFSIHHFKFLEVIAVITYCWRFSQNLIQSCSKTSFITKDLHLLW